ncbi:superinfection immunity protein [Niastella sp. MAH-29]|uniref:Superinfection immunity protein n=2 Tax=Chitinophagaceae TaxID=563835 RepID=A0ABS3Z3C5_9BACT|nr:superinfection immunity protein [Niastella soli]
MPGGSEWILVMLVLLPLYFLPSIIAIARKNPNTTPIVILNLLLGWTFLGWIGTLYWAFRNKQPQQS